MSSYLIFTNQKTKKRLVFYPVPKNANTSTKLFFAKHLGIDKDYVFLSDDKPEYQFRDNMYEILKDKKNLLNFFPLKQKFSTVDAEEKCCIIRDPIIDSKYLVVKTLFKLGKRYFIGAVKFYCFLIAIDYFIA